MTQPGIRTNTEFDAIQDADRDETVTWLVKTLASAAGKLLDSGDHALVDLPLAQLRVVLALHAEEEESVAALNAVSMTRLSARLKVRMNALTQAADRLMSRGLVERERDPEDRRVVRLRLTEIGRSWALDRRERRRRTLETVWNRLSVSERRSLVDSVRTLEFTATVLVETQDRAAGAERQIESHS